MNQLDNKEVLKTLNGFRKYVISEARNNINDATGNLSARTRGEIEQTENGLEINFKMPLYGFFLNEGVSGTINKYNTEYSFKSKGGKRGLKGMPPPAAFDRWNVIRGRAKRDDKGRFLSRNDLNFATAVSVFKYGIKPTKFFTTAFETAYKSLPQELADAFAKDMSNLIKKELDANV